MRRSMSLDPSLVVTAVCSKSNAVYQTGTACREGVARAKSADCTTFAACGKAEVALLNRPAAAATRTEMKVYNMLQQAKAA